MPKVKKVTKPKPQLGPQPRVSAGAPRNAKVTRALHLSECTTKYARALTDPFAELSEVCVPDLHDVASYKLSTRLRTTMVAGTAGCASVVASGLGSSSDGAIAVATTAAYASANIPTFGAAGTANVLNSNFPYTSAQITAGNVLVRVAAMGVRVRYMGTELQRSGQVILWKTTSNETFGGQTTAAVLAIPTVTTCATDRSWHGISYIPTRPSDYEYGLVPYTMNAGSNHTIGVHVVGTTTNNAFEVELKFYYEIVPGTISPPLITPTHSDVLGFSAVRNFLEGYNFEIGPAAFKTLQLLIKAYAPSQVSFLSNVLAAATAPQLTY